MRFRYKAAASAGALLTGLAAMLVGTAGPAAAATVNVTFCNAIPGTSIQALFPQRGLGTLTVGTGSCLPFNGIVSPDEPYIIRVFSGNTYRDLAGHTIWGCHESVNAVGTYASPGLLESCGKWGKTAD